MPASRSLPFLSPLAKLVVFFQRSRDRWKVKCMTAKRQNKSLKLCLAKMKESRDRWKSRAIHWEGGEHVAGGSARGKTKNQSRPRRAEMTPRAICPR
jgi:hypothetical protein